MFASFGRRVSLRNFNPSVRSLCAETMRPSFAGNEDVAKIDKEPPRSFASLLRNSPFIQMGNPVGKVTYICVSLLSSNEPLYFQVVIGKIYHVVDDDLYIDFGHKFHCVCTRPRGPGSAAYARGQEVKVRIKKLESSEKFLGFESETSLLEADCVLIGLNK